MNAELLLKADITAFITSQVAELDTGGFFRSPLVGFATESDPLFAQLKSIVGSHHLLPEDVLPEAKSAVAFFIPFSTEIVNSNRGEQVSRQWAKAYIHGNDVINRTCAALTTYLKDKDISAGAVPATHNYNPDTLLSSWSHRSVAYIAGLGRFGINRMLLSTAGGAGRYGSMLISAELPGDPRPPDNAASEPCLYLKDGSCSFCIRNCPVQALSVQGINRKRCNEHLLKVSEAFSDIGFCDVCGKCVVGPCA